MPNCGNKITGALSKLSPVAYEKYNWAVFSNPRRFTGVLTFIIVCLTIDCNNFFLKALYWVPPDHEIMKFRIFMWGFAALATAKEWHEYISNPNHNKLGAFAWMTFYTCGIEVLMVIKAGRHEKLFDFSVFPWFVYLIWACFATAIFGGLYFSYTNEQKFRTPLEE
jgi:phosphatidylserine synthase 2